MKRTRFLVSTWSVLAVAACPVWGDGGFFVTITEAQASSLAQTRQEALLAIHGGDAESTPYVTYVLRTHYDGDPREFAWVVPVPATPTDVVAHHSAELFEELDKATTPRFMLVDYGAPRGACGCGGGLAAAGGSETGLVHVEASGQAGVFDWASLTSTGADALLSWLDDHDYNVPAEAYAILDEYVQQEMHFLALRITSPDELEENGQTEIPPIQFTCPTSRWFYPLAISRISAAEFTEVLIYVLVGSETDAADVQTRIIDPDALAYDPTTASQTNYEALFDEAIADAGGQALIIEYADTASSDWLYGIWPEAPPQAILGRTLTRLRTVIARDRMDLDFEFEEGAYGPVSCDYVIDITGDLDTAAVLGPPLVAALLFALFRTVPRGRTRRGRVPHPPRKRCTCLASPLTTGGFRGVGGLP